MLFIYWRLAIICHGIQKGRVTKHLVRVQGRASCFCVGYWCLLHGTSIRLNERKIFHSSHSSLQTCILYTYAAKSVIRYKLVPRYTFEFVCKELWGE